MPLRTYITSVAAICASASFTVVLLFAGIAAACGGNPPPPCEKPSVTTGSASASTTTAYLYGTVNPHGCHTTYTFKYGLTTSYTTGSSSDTAGDATFPVSASGFAYGLQPKTTYHYRLYATNSGGTSEGADKTFTTSENPPPPSPEAPAVTTEAATGITSSGATLNGSVDPNESSTTYEFKYGIFPGFLNLSTAPVNIGSGATSQKVKAEVGLDPGTTYYFQVSAKNSAGTSTGSEKSFTTSPGPWKAKSTPNPEGASDSNLYDVSCEPSTSVCTAVGKSTTSGVDSPIAQRWDGTSWSEQVAAKKSGATHTRLFGVDCPSETRCLAVGNHQSSEGPSVLSEIWNEGKWNVQTTPVPSESTSSEFQGIGCNSTATCAAVGSAMIGGVKKAIAERWTSPTWALSSIPIPAEAKSSQLDGVDCLWSNFCVAVGRYTTSSSAIKHMIVFWNGTEWSLQTAADPEGAAESFLLDVSCTGTPNRCTAVGGWRNASNERLPLAYRFNGVTTWTLQSTPKPTGSTESVFQDVSCASETSCTAVGSRLSSAGGSKITLAEAWNGTSWSIQGSPNPFFTTFSSFLGVSCRSTTCMGVGWSTNSSGTDTTLSEFRE